MAACTWRHPFDDSAQALDVCAIADGVLVHAQAPTPYVSDPDHPLNYTGSWTSDGCLVLKHSTEIGEGDDGAVEFYSIYQHLSGIPDALRDASPGAHVWRKDVIGQAGRIGGQYNRMHFEILADDRNVKRLMGARIADVSTQDGRTDACYGDIHFVLPAGVACCHADQNPQGSLHTPALQNDPSGEPFFVAMRYDQGRCTLTTYRRNGEIVGVCEDPASDVEYRLYDLATKYYPKLPSAGYELLRLGRMLGPDALMPADAPHWRKVFLPSGPAWVNLNNASVKKYSDADMPAWLGWRCVDATGGDSRCTDSDTLDLLQNLTASQDAASDDDATQTDSQGPSPQALRLARTVVKCTTEWDDSTYTKRYAWMEQPDPDGLGLSQEDVARRVHHAYFLCFWQKANLGMDSAPWHFEPREFIAHFKKCGWLSASELRQLLPVSAIREKAKGVWALEAVSFSPGVEQNIAGYRKDLNKALRKFGIANHAFRLAAFFGNALEETQWFSRTLEKTSDVPHKTTDGKIHDDNWYVPWQGRGFLQLTRPDNYFKYWAFLGRTTDPSLQKELAAADEEAHKHRDRAPLQDAKHPKLMPDMLLWRSNVATLSIEASQSAGAYWAWSGAASFADQWPVLQRETQSLEHTRQVYYRCESFGQVAATVNFGHSVTDPSSIAQVNGILARYQACTNALMVLSEGLTFPNARQEPQD